MRATRKDVFECYRLPPLAEWHDIQGFMDWSHEVGLTNFTHVNSGRVEFNFGEFRPAGLAFPGDVILKSNLGRFEIIRGAVFDRHYEVVAGSAAAIDYDSAEGLSCPHAEGEPGEPGEDGEPRQPANFTEQLRLLIKAGAPLVLEENVTPIFDHGMPCIMVSRGLWEAFSEALKQAEAFLIEQQLLSSPVTYAYFDSHGWTKIADWSAPNPGYKHPDGHIAILIIDDQVNVCRRTDGHIAMLSTIGELEEYLRWPG